MDSTSITFNKTIFLLSTAQNLLDELLEQLLAHTLPSNTIYVSKELYKYMSRSMQCDLLEYNGFKIIIDEDRRYIEYGYTKKSDINLNVNDFFNM